METLIASSPFLIILLFFIVTTFFFIALYEIIAFSYPKVEFGLLECIIEKHNAPVSVNNLRDAVIITSLITLGYPSLIFGLMIFVNRKLEPRSPAFIREMLKIKMKLK